MEENDTFVSLEFKHIVMIMKDLIWYLDNLYAIQLLSFHSTEKTKYEATIIQ